MRADMALEWREVADVSDASDARCSAPYIVSASDKVISNASEATEEAVCTEGTGAAGAAGTFDVAGATDAVGTVCVVGGVGEAVFGVRHRPDADGATADAVGPAGVGAVRPACAAGGMGDTARGQRPEVDVAPVLDARAFVDVAAADAGVPPATGVVAIEEAVVPEGWDGAPDRVGSASDADEFPTEVGRGGGLAAGGADAAGAGRAGGTVGIADVTADLAGAAMLRGGTAEPALGGTVGLTPAALAAVALEFAFGAAVAEGPGRTGPVAIDALAAADVERIGAEPVLAPAEAACADVAVGATDGIGPVEAADVDPAGAADAGAVEFVDAGLADAAPDGQVDDREPVAAEGGAAAPADAEPGGAPAVVPIPTGLAPRAAAEEGVGGGLDDEVVERLVADGVAVDGVDVAAADNVGSALGGGVDVDLPASGLTDDAVVPSAGDKEPGFWATWVGNS